MIHTFIFIFFLDILAFFLWKMDSALARLDPSRKVDSVDWTDDDWDRDEISEFLTLCQNNRIKTVRSLEWVLHDTACYQLFPAGWRRILMQKLGTTHSYSLCTSNMLSKTSAHIIVVLFFWIWILAFWLSLSFSFSFLDGSWMRLKVFFRSCIESC